MGGIADYSGAHVCEGVLGRGTLIALHRRAPIEDQKSPIENP